MSAKLRRWVCPDCGEGRLAPSRPRKDDVRRYCLSCSERTGRLVERSSPAIEAARARKAEAAEARRQKRTERNRVERERAREAEESHLTVRTLDATGRTVHVHIERELRRLARKLDIYLGEVTFQRRPVLRGHAWFSRIHVSCDDGVGWEDLMILLVHELVHLLAKDEVRDDAEGRTRRQPHGLIFREAMARAIPKAFPGVGRIPAKIGYRRQDKVITERMKARTERLARR